MTRSTPKKGPLYVAFDQGCGLCRRFARLVAALDRRRLVVADDMAHPRHPQLSAASARFSMMHAWDEREQRTYTGFAAVVQILLRIRGGFVLSPFLTFLEKTGLGEALYRAVAARRTCRR